jgi:hypothetical protein
MARSSCISPSADSDGGICRTLAEGFAGFLLSWLAVAISYRIGAVRAHYPEMTSFAPLGLIFSLLLSPLWLGVRVILLRHLSGPLRSAIVFLIPTVLVYLISMAGIFVLNKIWMTEPIY